MYTKMICLVFVLLVSCLFLITANIVPAWAGCILSHIDCRYDCIEYYPNGKDCKKTKKICETVCDEFDVKKSGETPHTGYSVKATDKSDKEVKRVITVSGKLDKVAGIGGETTGWAIELDADLEVTKGMKKVKHLEVDPNSKSIEPLKGKRVQVTGSLIWRHGVERGDYPVIMIETIKEIKTKK
jgi:hypothetical protein